MNTAMKHLGWLAVVLIATIGCVIELPEPGPEPEPDIILDMLDVEVISEPGNVTIVWARVRDAVTYWVLWSLSPTYGLVGYCWDIVPDPMHSARSSDHAILYPGITAWVWVYVHRADHSIIDSVHLGAIIIPEE